MAFVKQGINLANLTIDIGQISSTQNVGEIERQIFQRTMCAGNFLLGAQMLVKLTPGINFINIF